MTWALWLMGLVGPLALRVMAALGFVAVTFTGVVELTNQLVEAAVDNWSAIPSAVLQLVSLSGIPEVLGLLFGALTARVAMWAAIGLSRYVFKK